MILIHYLRRHISHRRRGSAVRPPRSVELGALAVVFVRLGHANAVGHNNSARSRVHRLTAYSAAARRVACCLSDVLAARGWRRGDAKASERRAEVRTAPQFAASQYHARYGPGTFLRTCFTQSEMQCHACTGGLTRRVTGSADSRPWLLPLGWRPTGEEEPSPRDRRKGARQCGQRRLSGYPADLDRRVVVAPMDWTY